jgi:hypothetical protein
MCSISPSHLGRVQDVARVYPDASDDDIGLFTDIRSVPWNELEIGMLAGGLNRLAKFIVSDPNLENGREDRRLPASYCRILVTA